MIIISFICLLILLIILTILYYIKVENIKNYINNFESYSAVLSYHMDKAYNIVYKDKILVYSIEGAKPNDQEFKNNTIDFCHLTLKLIGPTLKKEFIKLYGNEQTLYFIMTEYFNDRSENDEIRESSLNKLMEQEINE